MYTGNVWGIALLIAGFLAALIGFQLLISAVFPATAARAADALRKRAPLCVLVGVFVLIVTGVVSAAAFAVFGSLGGPGKLVNGLIAAALAFPLVLSLATFSRFVGERMPSPADEGRPWRATLRGGVTCGLAFTMPFVGWFVLLPAAVATGLGAAALSLFASRQSPAATRPAASEAVAA